MKTVKFLLFFFLLGYVVKAQDKTVSKDTIRETKIPSVTEPQQVQASKVIICGPSRSALIQILHILDGKIIDKIQFSKINPNSIKSMEVLKPNDAKAIYGAQGENGAIIIISKK